jgi:NAD(P)-dependent dehydrogenase (short-subunit alcohol dehydrogenase family)
VTAGSRALGAAIAREAACHGAAVAVNYHRSEAEARALCREIESAGGKAVPLQADVTDETQARRLLDASWEALGGLDILVNNYGPWTATPFTALTSGDYDRIMEGNVRTAFLLGRDVGLRMRESGEAGQTGIGVIVNIAATDAFERGRSVYGLAKAALVHLTEALAVELAPQVRVLAVAPGLIADNEDMTAAVVEAELVHTPLKRLVTRDEIAQVVCALCGPAFASVTGETIRMDGGARIPHTPPPS